MIDPRVSEVGFKAHPLTLFRMVKKTSLAARWIRSRGLVPSLHNDIGNGSHAFVRRLST